MATGQFKLPKDLTGWRVIILGGTYAGQEGVCVGKSEDGTRWAISPDNTNKIVQLLLDEEFGVLINKQGSEV
jgi:hypothetical protein